MKRAFAVLAGALTGLAACTDEPCAPWTDSLRAIESGRVDDLLRDLSPDYVDALGDRELALTDARTWTRAGEVAFDRNRCRPLPERSLSERRGEVEVDYAADLPGPVPWRVQGTTRVPWVRGVRIQIRSGWLTEVRDAQRLVFRLANARSPQDVEDLLLPSYREGLLNREEAAALWGHRTLRPTHARLELRRDRAHLDLHHRGFDDGSRILRLTLAPAAGRWRIAAGLQSLPPPAGPDRTDDSTLTTP